MKGGRFFRLDKRALTGLPPASALFMLPDRKPVGFDPAAKRFRAIGGKFFAVAAFLAPGHTASYCASYEENARARLLPLFSYAAVCMYRNRYYTSSVKVDADIRHDSRFIDLTAVEKNARVFKKALASNRLVKHLARCALVYCCPNAQNFFLGRFEAPLPVSPSCNSGCLGCISYQPKGSCPATQPRIRFTPTPLEVAQIALHHINNARSPIVSFGQGCEGEPLLEGDIVEKAIRIIRHRTRRGTININTNGSRPKVLAGLFAAGLDSARISLNSAREKYYTMYYRPKGYGFGDVLNSIKAAKSRGKFVSINYLTMPGFTDSRDEFRALKGLIKCYSIDMIQWRNLNYDPLRYFKKMGLAIKENEMLGIPRIMAALRAEYPGLRMGYFNPIKTGPRRALLSST